MAVLVPVLLLGLAFGLLLCHFGRRRKGSKSKVPLPPGSMGWPVLGETMQFFSQEPWIFFQGKQERYGDVFKTHLLGSPAIMVANPEGIRFVLTQEELFKPTFPGGKERILGRNAFMFHSGEYHLRIRRLALAAFRAESIRHAVPDIEALALATLQSMEAQHLVKSSFKEMKGFTFDVAALLILGSQVRQVHLQQLKESYYLLDAGYNSFPLNLPGTKFYKTMQARRRVRQVVKRIMADKTQQIQCQGQVQGDLLAAFMQCKAVSEEEIVDNVISLLFAAHGTSAAVITWLLKYLANSTDVLHAVTIEQEDIAKKKETPGLRWLDIHNAPFTSKVIQEALRASTILSFTYREAVRDVEYKGYLFPKGWRVLPLFRNMHHNANLFPDPHLFLPSRFQAAPKANAFMPFGQGTHSCVGSELAKLEIQVLLHHLTTKYSWYLLPSAQGVTYSPFPVPKDGLPISLSSKKTLKS